MKYNKTTLAKSAGLARGTLNKRLKEFKKENEKITEKNFYEILTLLNKGKETTVIAANNSINLQHIKKDVNANEENINKIYENLTYLYNKNQDMFAALEYQLSKEEDQAVRNKLFTDYQQLQKTQLAVIEKITKITGDNDKKEIPKIPWGFEK